MKKFLLIALMAIMFAVTASTNALAEEETECECGMDEEGMCLPCEAQE